MVEVTKNMIDAADYYLCGYYVADDDIENAIKDAIEESDEIRQLREQRGELLEALKEVLYCIHNDASVERTMQADQLARAAIAKAEGCRD